MTGLPDILEFDWDQGNLNKSHRKHGITPEESESVFADTDSLVLPDVGHSEAEERFSLIGNSNIGRHLYVVFTVRQKKIRIISARRMHREEVEKYEKIKKNSQV